MVPNEKTKNNSHHGYKELLIPADHYHMKSFVKRLVALPTGHFFSLNFDLNPTTPRILSLLPLWSGANHFSTATFDQRTPLRVYPEGSKICSTPPRLVGVEIQWENLQMQMLLSAERSCYRQPNNRIPGCCVLKGTV